MIAAVAAVVGLLVGVGVVVLLVVALVVAVSGSNNTVHTCCGTSAVS